ncbi:protein FAM53A-like [Tubulanus polymorphus]|uniref:protein FAM53A-like n=1 Tax=Tubulanus polymorphus TaxID=672921 RepID=UPI003DA1DE81
MVDIITEKFRVQTLHDVSATAESTKKFTNWIMPLAQSDFATAFKGTAGWDHNMFEAGAYNHGAFSAFRQTKTPQRSLETPTFSKHRKKYSTGLEICCHCEALSNVAAVPPKKRQCRSLSIPSNSTWCNHNVLKPIALRPHTNNNKSIKNRNSPLGLLRGSHVISPGCGLRSSSELSSSPRDSPVPRPASVSSGFVDSSSNSSFSTAPWFEQSTVGTASCFMNWFGLTRQNRSISVEEAISSGVMTGVSSVQQQQQHSGGSGSSSTIASPRRHRIMRSRSQPCVLSDRKCGVKRRREDDRPAVDFHKMKETAYQRRPRSVTMSQPLYIRSSSHSLSSLFADQQNKIFGLKPITGSPLDSSIPNAVLKSPTTSPTTEVSQAMEQAAEEIGLSQTDSGCGDPPEIVTFNAVGEDCSCHDDGAEDLFHIDIGNEIDLEQIEND